MDLEAAELQLRYVDQIRHDAVDAVDTSADPREGGAEGVLRKVGRRGKRECMDPALDDREGVS
jgi:hypothetical protein